MYFSLIGQEKHRKRECVWKRKSVKNWKQKKVCRSLSLIFRYRFDISLVCSLFKCFALLSSCTMTPTSTRFLSNCSPFGCSAKHLWTVHPSNGEKKSNENALILSSPFASARTHVPLLMELHFSDRFRINSLHQVAQLWRSRENANDFWPHAFGHFEYHFAANWNV